MRVASAALGMSALAPNSRAVPSMDQKFSGSRGATRRTRRGSPSPFPKRFDFGILIVPPGAEDRRRCSRAGLERSQMKRGTRGGSRCEGDSYTVVNFMVEHSTTLPASSKQTSVPASYFLPSIFSSASSLHLRTLPFLWR